MQPLGDIFAANAQSRPSPAQQSLKHNLHKNNTKTKFQIAEDAENVALIRSPPLQSPVPRPLFSKQIGAGKENRDSPLRATTIEDETRLGLNSTTIPVQWSPKNSTQDTVINTQEDTQIFTQESTQSTQLTQATQSFQRSVQLTDDERRDTGESFVSAKEAFGSRNASKEGLRDNFKDDTMEVDDRPDITQSEAQDTVIRHDASSIHEQTTAIHYEPSQSPPHTRVISEQYTVSAEMQEGLDTVNRGAHVPESKNLISSVANTHLPSDPPAHDDTVLHHDIEEQMDIDDDDVRSPSDGSSPVKPLVRKSSLTFASLPAREPLIAKKSMGNRVSRTSHVDQSKARSSQLGRFTGGKSLGGSQYTQLVDTHNDAMDVDDERTEPRREESEATKLHNSTSTKSLKERLNMLNQRNEPPKRISQNVVTSQSQSSAPPQPPQPSQPSYPHLPSGEAEKDDDDEDDDWISPIRTAAPATKSARPILSKSHSADMRPTVPKEVILPKPISVSNPDLSTVVESTTPAGSPTGKRNMDGPLSASKAKLYSAFRAAKEKIIGSSATSAQAKLDALAEAPMRPQLQPQSSSDDIFSPKRNDKAGTSLFSHLRSPSKESVKESVKSTKTTKIAALPGSPVKDDGRRTRSSSERERQKEKEKEARDKEAKQKQRTEDRLKEMREKEQSKAAAHYQKTKAAAKTPGPATTQANGRVAPGPATKTPVSVSQAPQSRPGVTRTNTEPRQQEPDSADEMPPPAVPPKSLLPTGTGHKLREPKRLVKAPSKDTLPKGKPQSIRVNLHPFGQAPKPAAKPAAAPAPKVAPTATSKQAPTASKLLPTSKSAAPAPAHRAPHAAPKPAPRVARPQQQPPKAPEKPKPTPAQSRADLGGARPVSRMQTVQDANRINVPPINPAKPAKRPFQPENDEPLHRPAKRPSQQAKSKPVTPAHAQFAQGKIPFAEPLQPAQPAQPALQYPNGEEIKLPDIMTDSEDEDSDNEFQQPDWVNTPNLRDMLQSQTLMDPEQIFGPIAPLNMEQIFPNRERHKRFRDRTSSAYWINDQATEEDRRKEREARERLVREGAWTYNPSPRPEPRN